MEYLSLGAKLVREKSDCYPLYKKLMKMNLDQSEVDTLEYKVLAKHYPHLAESIKLKRGIKTHKRRLISEKVRTTRLQIRREINNKEAKLKLETVLKRLHGESKQETIFHINLGIDILKERISLAFNWGYMTLTKTYVVAQRGLRRLMYRKLPPSLFDLKSLDTAEKGMALREWIQTREKTCR